MGLLWLLLTVTHLSASISNTDDQTLYGFPTYNVQIASPYSLQICANRQSSQVSTVNAMILIISATVCQTKTSVFWAIQSAVWPANPVATFCQCSKLESSAYCSGPQYMANGLKTCQHVTFSIPLRCHTVRRICESHKQLQSIADIASNCPVILCAMSVELEQIGGCCHYRNSSTLTPTTPKFRPPKILTVPTTTFVPNTTANATISREDPHFYMMVITGTSVGTSIVGLFLLTIGICCCCRKKRVPANVNDIRLKRFARKDYKTRQTKAQQRPPQKAKNSDSDNTATGSSGSEESVFSTSVDVAAYSRFTNEKVK